MPPLVIAGIISGVVGLTSLTVGAVQQGKAMTTECEKGCKSQCKIDHKLLFDGRQKCIKGCPAECVNANQPPAQEGSGINWWYVASGILIIASILLFVFRKKIFPAK